MYYFRSACVLHVFLQQAAVFASRLSHNDEIWDIDVEEADTAAIPRIVRNVAGAGVNMVKSWRNHFSNQSSSNASAHAGHASNASNLHGHSSWSPHSFFFGSRTVGGSRSGNPARYVLKVAGFKTADMNGLYTMRDEVHVGNHPTYWSLSGLYFFYQCPNSGTWSIAFYRSLEAVKKSDCEGYAYHPTENQNTPYSIQIFGRGWSEYVDQTHWEEAPSAGIVEVVKACSSFESDSSTCKAKGCDWRQGVSSASSQCVAPWGVFGPNGPQFNDVAQGVLGTCYFLAALVAISHSHPKVIQDMITPLRDTAEGVFATQWAVLGHPIQVDIDSWIPVGESGRPSFSSYFGGRHFWSMLLEKAWAKIFRNYRAVDNGFPGEAFSAITQAPVENFVHRTADMPNAPRLWEKMQWALYNHYPLLASSGRTTSTGVKARHVFAVLDVSVMTIGGKRVATVHLLDTMKVSSYRGKIPTSINTELDTGHIRMAIDEYFADFVITTIAHLHEGYVVTPRTISKESQQVAAEFEFSMQGDAPFAVQLAWPDSRLVNTAGCKSLSPGASLEVFKNGVSQKRVSRNAKQAFAHLAEETPGVYALMPGGAGQYRVSVSADFPSGPWLRNVVLNTYAPASERVQFRQAGEKKRAVLLAGFRRSAMNHWYIEKLDPSFLAGERESYWTATGDYVLYWCKTKSVWMITYKDHWKYVLAAVPGQECPMFARAPQYREVTTPPLVKGWREYDPTGRRWIDRPYSGVAKLDVVDANTSSLLQVNAGHEQPSSDCSALLDRLDQLHNWRDIAASGKDPLFPPTIESIADPGQKCTFDQNSPSEPSASCDQYSMWRTLSDIASDEPP